jgi:hypothetical protein
MASILHILSQDILTLLLDEWVDDLLSFDSAICSKQLRCRYESGLWLPSREFSVNCSEWKKFMDWIGKRKLKIKRLKSFFWNRPYLFYNNVHFQHLRTLKLFYTNFECDMEYRIDISELLLSMLCLEELNVGKISMSLSHTSRESPDTTTSLPLKVFCFQRVKFDHVQASQAFATFIAQKCKLLVSCKILECPNFLVSHYLLILTGNRSIETMTYLQTGDISPYPSEFDTSALSTPLLFPKLAHQILSATKFFPSDDLLRLLPTPNIRTLSLHMKSLSKQSLLYQLIPTYWQQLEYLILRECDWCRERDFFHLVGIHCTQLQSLRLSDCHYLDTNCFAAIGQSFQALEHLTVDYFNGGVGSMLTDEAIFALNVSTFTSKITYLHLSNCPFLTLQAYRMLFLAFPQLEELELELSEHSQYKTVISIMTDIVSLTLPTTLTSLSITLHDFDYFSRMEAERMVYIYRANRVGEAVNESELALFDIPRYDWTAFRSNSLRTLVINGIPLTSNTIPTIQAHCPQLTDIRYNYQVEQSPTHD